MIVTSIINCWFAIKLDRKNKKRRKEENSTADKQIERLANVEKF
jgi:hypothetical protein